MDYRAEFGLIGSIMLKPEYLPEIRGIVTAKDFQTEPGRATFLAACRLADSDTGIDPITLMSESGVEEQWLHEVLDLTPTAEHALEYARQLRKERQMASIRAMLASLTEKAEDGDPAAVIGAVHEALDDLGEDYEGTVVRPEDALAGFLSHIDRIKNGDRITVATGFPSVDNILGGGMLKTGLYIMAARPGVGKTSLGLAVAEMASRRSRVLFVSLEMSETEIMARRHANIAGIYLGRLLHSPLTDEEALGVGNAQIKMSQRQFFLNRTNTATVAEIGVMARSCRAELVVIDYLGLIQCDLRNASSYERVTRISGDLKRLARALKCPVLCLAQLNRQSESRSDKRPSMADLRDSGAIEQDADGILLLHRPMLYAKEEWNGRDGQPFEVDIAKNRHGPTGKAVLTWWATDGRFQDGNTNSWL